MYMQNDKLEFHFCYECNDPTAFVLCLRQKQFSVINVNIIEFSNGREVCLDQLVNGLL